MALPVTKNLSVYQGDSFELVFRLLNRDSEGNPAGFVDLTNSIARSQIRNSEGSPTILATFDAEHNNAGGQITLSLTTDQTTALTNGMWDVQVEFPDGQIKTYLRGTVTVQKEITHA